MFSACLNNIVAAPASTAAFLFNPVVSLSLSKYSFKSVCPANRAFSRESLAALSACSACSAACSAAVDFAVASFTACFASSTSIPAASNATTFCSATFLSASACAFDFFKPSIACSYFIISRAVTVFLISSVIATITLKPSIAPKLISLSWSLYFTPTPNCSISVSSCFILSLISVKSPPFLIFD